MSLRGSVFNNIIYNASYYNQFVTGGGNNYIQGNQNNIVSARFNPNGSLNYFGYQTNYLTTPNELEILVSIDNQDNKIVCYHANMNSTMSPTAGTWLQSNPQTSSKNMLIKRSSNGSIIWSTYLPSTTQLIYTITDNEGNIYVSGLTSNQNLSTPGVFQENFDVIYSQGNGNIVDNNYLAKLNANGELIWASYLPFGISNMQYYDHALYMITGINTNPSLNTIATNGSFQSTKSEFSVTKINTENGQRSWGTYYGPAFTTSLYFLYDLAVNETGLYLTGTDYNLNNSNFFATSNAYKTQVTGSSDLFLTKFSLDGNRIWSTYFGGNGEEINTFDKVIDLNGDEIFITGTTSGSTDNIATVGSYQETPQNSTITSNNSFFAKFNATGSLQWSSYYGGSSTNSGFMKSINVKYDNNSLFLFGSTNSNTGFTTNGAYMPVRNPSTTLETSGYIARLNKKNALSVTDVNKNTDLVLYNNPNNGIFSISGNILQNEACKMTVYDLSGKLISTKNLERKKEQQFNMQSPLSSGNYLIQINNERGEKLKVFKMTVKK